MFCPKCGARNDDGAPVCTSCGQSLENAQGMYENPPAAQPINEQTDAGGPPIKDFFVGNIILTVLAGLCCACYALVTGIIGIVFSSKTRESLGRNDRAGAESSAKTAKIMFYVTLGLVIITAIGIIAYICLIAAGISYGLFEDLAHYPYPFP